MQRFSCDVVFLLLLGIVGGPPAAYALVEFETTKGPAAKQFENESIKAKKEKKFNRPNSLPQVAAATASKLQGFENETKGTVIVDEASGKITTAILALPVIPGNGHGNRLLWSVGTTVDDGHGPLQDHRRLADVVDEAVRGWFQVYSDSLLINVKEFASVSTGVNGDTVQIAYRRQYKGVEVEDDVATATVNNGNLIHIGVEEWADIPSDFNTTPTLSAADAVNAVADYIGYATNGKEANAPKLKIISIAQNFKGQGNTQSSVSGNSATNNNNGQGQGPPFAQGYTYKLVWEVHPEFDEQTVENFIAQVDAQTGEVYKFEDSNDYFESKGGTFAYSNDGVGPEGKEQDGK